MANFAAYAKQYGDLMADYEKNWKGKIDLAQYGKMHYDAYGKKEGRKVSGGSTSKSSGSAKKSGFEVDGVTYPVGTSSKILGSNPNEGYKARATLESGHSQAVENVQAEPIGGINLRMNKRGIRYFLHPDGVTYYEEDPGSGQFVDRQRGGYKGMKISEYTHREEPKPEQPPKSAPAPQHKAASASAPAPSDPIDDSIQEAIASLNAWATDFMTNITAPELAASDPAEEAGVASNAGYSSTVLTSGAVDEETSPTALTPTSAAATDPYKGSTTLTSGTQVVDTVNGKVYPNKVAALADGVKAWMPKTQWDALQEAD